VVAGVHDAGARDEGRAEGGDHDDEGAPDLALGVHNVQFRREVQREIEQAGKGDYVWSAEGLAL
jgi:hypothetical protein